jgi:hypothetical protein
VVVKTWEDEGLIFDLVENFNNMRKFKLKLNPEKCTFYVPSGKLLGYMVSRSGINPNPEKVSIITKMKPPVSLCQSGFTTLPLAYYMSSPLWFVVGGAKDLVRSSKRNMRVYMVWAAGA